MLLKDALIGRTYTVEVHPSCPFSWSGVWRLWG